MVDREFYVDEQKPMFVDNLQQIVNKIYVAVALCSYGVGANVGALKLDSCIKRYCTHWSDPSPFPVLSFGDKLYKYQKH